MMGFMGTGMILWWVIPILLVVGLAYLFRSLAGSGRNSSESNSRTPLDILRERYARGEINREEYQSRKKDLSQI